MELLIQDVLWQGRRVDVAIAEGVFTAIEPAGTLEPTPSTTCLSGRHFLLRSPFYNTHTHLVAQCEFQCFDRSRQFGEMPSANTRVRFGYQTIITLVIHQMLRRT